MGIEVRLWSLITQKRSENLATTVNLNERQTNSYVNNNNNVAFSSCNSTSNPNSNNNYNNFNNNNNNSVALNHKNTRSSLRRNSNKRCDSEYDSCSE